MAGALVDISLAVLARETRSTHTLIAVHQVLTRSSVQTLSLTVVNIDLTVLSRPTREALAEVSTNQVTAGVGIHARVLITLISIDQAGFAAPLRGADAPEAVDQIHTGTGVITGVRTAVVFIDGAGGSGPAWSAAALEPLTALHTAPPVKTRLRQTRVIRSLAILAGVALRTGAVVLVWSCVTAGSSIQTGLPRATGVQVFITELSSPVSVTQALPGLHTGPVHTARVRNTLITELPLPAVQTLAVSRHLTGPMLSTAALPTHRSVALWTGPALHAGLVSVVVAVVVAEEVVSGPAELVAADSVVVLVAAHANLVRELSDGAVMPQNLPVTVRVNHARLNRLLNQLTTRTAGAGVIVEVHGLQDQCVRPRPGEAEGQHDASTALANQNLSRHCVPPQHRRGSTAEAARPSHRHA